MDKNMTSAVQEGEKLAKEHARLLQGVYAGTLFQQKNELFYGLELEAQICALSSYAQTLIKSEIPADQSSNPSLNGRDLVIKQLSKILRDNSLKRIVQQNQVNKLIVSCQQAWEDDTEDFDKKKERYKRLNDIFQTTQENYGGLTGVFQALYGFRMIGQTQQLGSTSPFIINEPIGKDSAIQRLSFFLRRLTKLSGIKKSLESNACGKDLVSLWCLAVLKSQGDSRGMTKKELQRQHEDILICTSELNARYPEIIQDKLNSMPGEAIEKLITYEGPEISAVEGVSVIKRFRLMSFAKPETGKCQEKRMRL